jgi:hypothetical protein
MSFNHKLLNLLDYVNSIDELKALDKYVSRHKLPKDEEELFFYFKTHINHKSRGRYLSSEVIQVQFSPMPKKKILELTSSIIDKIETFLILKELNENQLIKDWFLLKALKREKNQPYINLFSRFAEEINFSSIEEKDTFEQFVYFDFASEIYQEESHDNDAQAAKKALEDVALCYNVFTSELKANVETKTNQLNNEELKPTPTNYVKLSKQIKEFPNTVSAEDFIAPFKSFFENKNMTKEKKGNLFLPLLNRAAAIAHQGNKAVLIDNWDYLLKIGVEEEVLFENGTLPFKHFCNLLSTAASMEDNIKKVAYLKENFVTKIKKTEQKEAKAMCVLFEQYSLKKFSDVITTIQRNEEAISRHPFLTVRIHTFLIRSYYEVVITEKSEDRQKKERLFAAVKSFGTYLKRDEKQPKHTKQNNENFFIFVKRLLENFELDELQALENDVEAAAVVHKGWLLTKIQEKKILTVAALAN